MHLIFGGSSEVYRLSAEARHSFVTLKVFLILVKIHESGSPVTCPAPGVKGLSPLSSLGGQSHRTHFLCSNRSGFSLAAHIAQGRAAWRVGPFRASQQVLLVSLYGRKLRLSIDPGISSLRIFRVQVSKERKLQRGNETQVSTRQRVGRP